MQKVSENDEIIIYYKEKGEHTLPSSDYTKDDSLFIYRLDKVTSGLLVQAKNEDIYQKLKEVQKMNLVIKTYEAIARKDISDNFTDSHIKASIEQQGSIETMIDENKSFTIESYFRPYGKGRKCVKAVSADELKKYKDKDVTTRLYTTNIISSKRTDDGNVIFTVEIRNGFRHQIRSHLASIGYPILGDTLYGGIIPEGKEEVYKKGIALECVTVEIPGDL